MFPQTPPHARGARATEPAPLMCIRHGSRHHVHEITCSGTGSGTSELHCNVVPRLLSKKDRKPGDQESDRRSTVLTMVITRSPSPAVSTQRCQILACEAIKSCLFFQKSQFGPQLLPCPMLRGRVYVMFLSDRVTQEGSWTSPCHVHEVGLHRAADGSPCFEGGGPVPAAFRGQPRSDQAPGPVATRPQQQLQLQCILRASSSRVTFPPRPGHCHSVPPPPLHVEADEPSASRPITRTRRCR